MAAFCHNVGLWVEVAPLRAIRQTIGCTSPLANGDDLFYCSPAERQLFTHNNTDLYIYNAYRPPDALRRRTHLDGRADSFHTATPDTTRLSRLPVDRRRDAGQAGSMQLFLAARPPARSDVVRQENVNTLWIVAYD